MGPFIEKTKSEPYTSREDPLILLLDVDFGARKVPVNYSTCKLGILNIQYTQYVHVLVVSIALTVITM